MSSTGPVSGITFSGLASGVNTQSIIQKLIQIGQVPITNLQNQEQAITLQQTAIQQLEQNAQAFSSAAQALSTQSSFQTVAGNSSDSSVATVTAGVGAQQGIYNLVVNNLATSQKLSSSAQANTTGALNLSGTFIIDGHAVSVSASDSLTTIAQSINSSGAPVTASLINGGSGNSYLTVTSNGTGAANSIQLSDLTGGVLGSLGVTTGSPTIAQPITNGAQSYGFSSNSASLGSLMGLSSNTAGTFSINGTNISVDYSTDSLQSVANKINLAGAGVNATVASTTTNGVTSYQLQITGTSSTPTFTDPNNLLGAIGVLQSSPGNQLVKAQDAAYSLDGVNLTSSSNTITSAIPGVTLTLLKGSSSAPANATISLQTNTAGITTNVQNFVSAYNSVVSFIAQNSQFNSTTYATGPLFGDFTTQQVQSQLSSALFNNVPGLSGQYTNLAQLGFSLDQNGNLSVNQTTLTNALNTNPQAVANLFAASGSTTTPQLNYISSSPKTQSSGSAYAVNISQAATQSSATSSVAQTAANPTAETLSFSGSLFGTQPYSMSLDVNSTQAETVAKINSDPTLGGLVVASVSGGQLVITSKMYGAQSNFSVVSNEAAAANNSGIGTTGQATLATGQDVAGTINGEAATGTGQYLVGNSGNKITDGLQVQYTGTTSGAVGSITYSAGIGTQIQTLVNNMTDPNSGYVTQDIQSYTNQINDINSQITNLQSQLTQEQAQLTSEFANMENLIAQYQQQGAGLNSLLGTSSSSSASSSASVSTGGH